jgi:NADH-quinone oxidoreductase subunit C
MKPTLEQLSQEFAQLIGPAPAAPPPAAGSAPAAPPLTAVQVVVFAARGVNLDVTVAPDQVVAAAQLLDRHGFSLDTITGVDWLAQGQMEVVYDYMHFTVNLRIAVRTRVPRDQAAVPTISTVFPGANWHERETHDFFGIYFTGHPKMSPPFLLPEDADFHPLKKDYKP